MKKVSSSEILFNKFSILKTTLIKISKRLPYIFLDTGGVFKLFSAYRGAYLDFFGEYIYLTEILISFLEMEIVNVFSLN